MGSTSDLLGGVVLTRPRPWPAVEWKVSEDASCFLAFCDPEPEERGEGTGVVLSDGWCRWARMQTPKRGPFGPRVTVSSVEDCEFGVGGPADEDGRAGRLLVALLFFAGRVDRFVVVRFGLCGQGFCRWRPQRLL